jgi:hypothetical protein
VWIAAHRIRWQAHQAQQRRHALPAVGAMW